MIARDPMSIFVGQGMRFDGQRMWETFSDVPMDRRVEFPVAEDTQLGFCTGLALRGFLPVCVFPRIDFFILAMNALVNHLDKLPLLGEYRPKVIIRTAIGARPKPGGFNVGIQHTQNHVTALRHMLKTVDVVELIRAKDVFPAYEAAVRSTRSTILAEHMASY